MSANQGQCPHGYKADRVAVDFSTASLGEGYVWMRERCPEACPIGGWEGVARAEKVEPPR